MLLTTHCLLLATYYVRLTTHYTTKYLLHLAYYWLPTYLLLTNTPTPTSFTPRCDHVQLGHMSPTEPHLYLHQLHSPGTRPLPLHCSTESIPTPLTPLWPTSPYLVLRVDVLHPSTRSPPGARRRRLRQQLCTRLQPKQCRYSLAVKLHSHPHRHPTPPHRYRHRHCHRHRHRHHHPRSEERV